MKDRIDPEDLIEELSIEQLCATAEDYYANLTDYTFQMAKPFGSVMDAPDLLYKMGLMISGLRLGQGMTVLDFGAGTGWFSRFLNQMRCATISVDPSPTALRIGEELFERLPVIGGSIAPPRFISFDGHQIELPDASVDRIVCFDAFHHVPNGKEVLAEFYRVLKDGGVAGFSEPGLFHSQSAQSQYEMRNYKVLENDIRLDEIKQQAEAIGFRELRIKLVHPHSQDLTYNDYVKLTRWRLLPLKVWHGITVTMRQMTTFFFTKGTFRHDSRRHVELSHKIEVLDFNATGRIDEPLYITVQLTNTGKSKWLHKNVGDIGVVKVGVHLYDASGKLLNLDFARATLSEDVASGHSLVTQVPVVFTQAGSYQLAIDLVSEHVCWFENLGSQPRTVMVQVARANSS